MVSRTSKGYNRECNETLVTLHFLKYQLFAQLSPKRKKSKHIFNIILKYSQESPFWNYYYLPLVVRMTGLLVVAMNVFIAFRNPTSSSNIISTYETWKMFSHATAVQSLKYFSWPVTYIFIWRMPNCSTPGQAIKGLEKIIKVLPVSQEELDFILHFSLPWGSKWLIIAFPSTTVTLWGRWVTLDRYIFTFSFTFKRPTDLLKCSFST